MHLLPRFLFTAAFCVVLWGCGSRPALHPISGKISLDGKTYERLIVYLRPLDVPIQPYNLGVGETDAAGNLALRSTDGLGLPAGKYRVSFSCIVNAKSRELIGISDSKQDDDRRLVTEDIVPFPYSSDTESPFEFEVKSSGDNVLEFDIPADANG